jgi:hypothetical protein
MLGLEKLGQNREDYETKYIIMGPLKNPTRFMVFLSLDWMVKLCWNFLIALKMYEMCTDMYVKSYNIIFSTFICLFCLGHITCSIIFFPIIIAFEGVDNKHVSACSKNSKCLKMLCFFKVILWLMPIMLMDMFHFMYIMFAGFGFFNAKDRLKS